MALIIDMEMPKCCEWSDSTSKTGMRYCPLIDVCKAYRNEVSKQYTINAHPIDYFPSDCPIIGEIPDSHGDLIDRGLVQEVLAQLLPLVITNELTDKEIGLVHRTVGAIAEMINEQEVVVEATE